MSSTHQKTQKTLETSFGFLFHFFSSLLGFTQPWKNVCNIFHKHHHLLMYCKSETAQLFGCLVTSEVSSFIKRSNTGKCFSSENRADEKLLELIQNSVSHRIFNVVSFGWTYSMCGFFPLITTSIFVCIILMQRFYFDFLWEMWKPHLGNLAGISVEE